VLAAAEALLVAAGNVVLGLAVGLAAAADLGLAVR
jgi:hypothetical protein